MFSLTTCLLPHHVNLSELGALMRVVELFCGAGGMSLGLSRSGMNVVGAFDWMKDAVNTYRANLGDHVQKFDLSDVLAIVPKVRSMSPDLIAGGPPCQDYSAAGQRIEGKNARLTLAFAMVIVGVRPEWFVMENVVQAATSDTWAEAKAILKHAGYGISENKLSFDQWGVPQARRRLVVVGRLGERDNFLNSSLAAKAGGSMPLRETFTIRNAGNIAGSEIWSPEIAKLISGRFVFSRPQRAGRAVRTVDEPYTTIVRTSGEKPSPKFRAKYQAHARDPATLDEASVLSPKILSMIQGFPARWKWVTRNKRQKMIMIANAVPPPAAKRIGEVILARAKGRTAPAIEGNFRTWLLRGGGRSRETANNIVSNARRARKLLGGRTFSDPAIEMATLLANPIVEAMRSNTRSDLCQALRHYEAYLDYKNSLKKNPDCVKVRRIVIERPPTIDLAELMARLPARQSEAVEELY